MIFSYNKSEKINHFFDGSTQPHEGDIPTGKFFVLCPKKDRHIISDPGDKQEGEHITNS